MCCVLPMTIQNKITLLFSLLTASIILMLSVFIYVFTSGTIENSFFHRLEVRAHLYVQTEAERNESRNSVYQEVKEKHLKNLPSEQHEIVHVGANGTYVKTDLLKRLPENFMSEVLTLESYRLLQNDTSYTGIYLRTKEGPLCVISLAYDEMGLEELRDLKRTLIIGFFLSVLVVYSAGRFFSYNIFKPVREIISKVKGISADNLNKRVDEGNNKDEIHDLAHTFNGLLARLETAFELQNNFVSNASHEFRTPLTVIAGEAELGLAREDHPETKKAFDLIWREAEKLNHLVQSMLSLAQTGFDGQKQQFAPVRIDELLFAAKATANNIFPGNQVVIHVEHFPEDEKQLTVLGNFSLLNVAFSNIILNACKYSDNKSVEVDVHADSKYISIRIADKGIGIPEKELPQIFVPFFRASNTNSYEGHGIGLPLAMNIVRLHQGLLDAFSNEGQGTVLIIRLPYKA